MQEQKDAQTKIMLEELVKEVTEKELVIKVQLAREIQSLQEEKVKIENKIRGIYSNCGMDTLLLYNYIFFHLLIKYDFSESSF